MSAYNLPPLEGFRTPDIAGRWTELADFNTLAVALHIPDKDIDPGEIKSIPDCWAQIQLTRDALFNRGHEAHREVRAQWRGLLTLFALQLAHSGDYSLEIKCLDIATDPKIDARSRLHGILRDLVPLGGICGLDFGQVGIVDFVPEQGKPHRSLAMLSPLTLVAPGRSASAFRGALPWLKDGLRDPLEATLLRPDAWTLLESFLGDLEVAIRPFATAGGQRDDVDALLGEITAFRKDCEKQAERLGLAVVPRKETVDTVWPRPFYENLGANYLAAPPENGCTLVVRDKALLEQAGVTNIVLVDSEIAKTLKCDPNDILVWRNHTLLEAMVPAKLEAIRKEAAQEGVAVLTADDIFTRELVKMTKRANVAAHSGNLRDKLLPLSPLALFCAPGESIQVDLTKRGDTYNIGFTVELELADGRRISHTMRRAYTGEAVVEMDPPDDLAIWPNFADRTWPWTFLRYQYDPSDDLQIRFGLTRDVVLADLAAGKGDAVARLADWTSDGALGAEKRLFGADLINKLVDAAGKPLLDRLRFVTLPKLVAEQHQLYRGVDAIFFSRRCKPGDVDIPAGCVLVNREPAEPATKSARVAIDFGSSNTVAYASINGATEERQSFAARVAFPVGHDRDDTVLNSAYTDFFPLQHHGMPLPTVLKARNFKGNLTGDLLGYIENPNTQRTKGGRSITGLSHMLFFMPRANDNVSPAELVGQVRSGLLVFGIKWGEGEDHSFLIETYLRQLMIMIAAELRAQGVGPRAIEWHFSYPQAFDPDQFDGFSTAVGSQVKLLRGDAGAEEPADPEFMTEGEAASWYFTDDGKQVLTGVGPLLLMLDIGGGTTDIAIRFRGAPVWRGSVKLAAGDFFRNYLANNSAVLEAVDPEAMEQYAPRSGKGEKSQATSGDKEKQMRELIDLLVAKPDFAEAFDYQYSVNIAKQEWRGLRQAASVALGGILYYVGLVLAELIEDGAIRLSAADLSDISVALGGRGSTIFRKLDTRAEGDTRLQKLFRLTAAAAGIDAATPHVRAHFSPGPKEEVARGLLLAEGNEGAPAPDRRMPIALEAQVSSEGASVRLDADTPIEKLAAAEEVEQIDMARFRTFLEELDRLTGLSIDVARAGTEQKIRNVAVGELSSRLRRLRARKQKSVAAADTQNIEAPFITALSALVKFMSMPVAERDAQLGVQER